MAGEGEVAGSPGGQVVQPGSAGSGVVGGGWRESLPEPIRGEKSFDVFKGKDWNEVGPVMAKSFLDSQKMIGNAVKLPLLERLDYLKPDATPEEKQKFNDEIYGKLGRPDKPENYQFQRPAFGEGMWDANLEKTFRGIAFKMGLNHAQVQELVNFEASRIQTGLQNNRKQQEGQISQLKNEWGADFPRKATLANRAYKQIANDLGILEEANKFFISTGFDNHPIVLKIFSEIGEFFSESGFIDGRVAGANGASDIKAKIDSMFTDPKHPLNDISHALHKQAVEEYTNLFKQYSELKG